MPLPNTVLPVRRQSIILSPHSCIKRRVKEDMKNIIHRCRKSVKIPEKASLEQEMQYRKKFRSMLRRDVKRENVNV
jgi:hypothetical protein